MYKSVAVGFDGLCGVVIRAYIYIYFYLFIYLYLFLYVCTYIYVYRGAVKDFAECRLKPQPECTVD